jgi:hypothetical protein
MELELSVVVVEANCPSYLGGKDRKYTVQGQPGKVSKILSQKQNKELGV